MTWMLDQLRGRRPARNFPATARLGIRRRQRLAVESLEGRSLLSLASFFAGLFPSYTSTSTTNATLASQKKILDQPTNVSFPPYTISLGVNNANDPGSTGVVFNTGHVEIQGVAPDDGTVWLAYGPLGYFNTVTKADANGNYTFNVSLPQGTTEIRTFAENFAEAYSQIASIRVTNADPIVAWDALAIRAIASGDLTQEEASRDLAILHTAQYDAVAAVTDPNAAFAVHAAATPGSSATEAANAAGAAVLTALFPSATTTFQTAYLSATAGLPNNAATANGATLGVTVAQQTLAARANDGSTVATPAGVIPNPNWSQVQPFALTSAAQFRPAAPPAVGTAAYDQALTEVESLGRANSTTRTAAETAEALFWDDPIGTVTDPGHWNAITEELTTTRKVNLFQTARVFAQLDVALADSAIAASDSKETYNEARPIVAIRATSDPTYTPLDSSPTTASYVSEHAAFGAAASDVLAATFGKSTAFTTGTAGTPAKPTTTFKNFATAASQEAASRIYGGVNFSFDTTAGSTLGNSVGKLVLAKFPK